MPDTEAGRALLGREAMNSRSFALITEEAIAAIERQAAARALAEVRGLREAAASLYSIAVGEHGHDETHSADWPSCLPAHIAMRRYRAAIEEASRG